MSLTAPGSQPGLEHRRRRPRRCRAASISKSRWCSTPPARWPAKRSPTCARRHQSREHGRSRRADAVLFEGRAGSVLGRRQRWRLRVCRARAVYPGARRSPAQLGRPARPRPSPQRALGQQRHHHVGRPRLLKRRHGLHHRRWRHHAAQQPVLTVSSVTANTFRVTGVNSGSTTFTSGGSAPKCLVAVVRSRGHLQQSRPGQRRLRLSSPASTA